MVGWSLHICEWWKKENHTREYCLTSSFGMTRGKKDGTKQLTVESVMKCLSMKFHGVYPFSKSFQCIIMTITSIFEFTQVERLLCSVTTMIHVSELNHFLSANSYRDKMMTNVYQWEEEDDWLFVLRKRHVHSFSLLKKNSINERTKLKQTKKLESSFEVDLNSQLHGKRMQLKEKSAFWFFGFLLSWSVSISNNHCSEGSTRDSVNAERFSSFEKYLNNSTRCFTWYFSCFSDKCDEQSSTSRKMRSTWCLINAFAVSVEDISTTKNEKSMELFVSFVINTWAVHDFQISLLLIAYWSIQQALVFGNNWIRTISTE